MMLDDDQEDSNESKNVIEEDSAKILVVWLSFMCLAILLGGILMSII